MRTTKTKEKQCEISKVGPISKVGAITKNKMPVIKIVFQMV